MGGASTTVGTVGLVLGGDKKLRRKTITSTPNGGKFIQPTPLMNFIDRFDEAGCRALAMTNHEACHAAVGASGKSGRWKKVFGSPACVVVDVADIARCEELAAAPAASDAADWIRAHPGAVVLTVVTIAGATFIVSSTGGGALTAVPALAL